MVLPVGTDAPNPRAPIGTFSLIAANVVLFCLQGHVIPESVCWLDHDGTINPIQWLVSAFAHADPCHLIGNMIFLFSFGMAVESAMRTWRFVAVYLATAILECGVEQIFAAWVGGYDGGSIGASSAIYGTMMIGLLCVPSTNIQCFYLFNFYSRFSWGIVEVPVALFAAFYFFWDFGLALFTGFELSTPFLHALGAVSGVVVGLVVYRIGWYESDGQDLISQIKEAWDGPEETNRRSRETLLRKSAERAIQNRKKTIQEIDLHLAQGGLHRVLRIVKQNIRRCPDFQLNEKQIIQIVNLSTRRKEYEIALEWIDEYLSRFEKIGDLVKLKKARILLVAFRSPKQAMEQLSGVDRRKLTAVQRRLYQQIRARALQLQIEMANSGEFEIRRS